MNRREACRAMSARGHLKCYMDYQVNLNVCINFTCFPGFKLYVYSVCTLYVYSIAKAYEVAQAIGAMITIVKSNGALTGAHIQLI